METVSKVDPNHNIFWFRRDLRLEDNHGLYRALAAGLPVRCIFIFDTNITNELPKSDARITYIHHLLSKLKTGLQSAGSDLDVYIGSPTEILNTLATSPEVKGLFANRDYEPYAQKRDKRILDMFQKNGKFFKGFRDHVVFEKDDILKNDGTPYTVYTPYSKQWKQKFSKERIAPVPSEKLLTNLLPFNASHPLPTLSSLGFEATTQDIPSLNWSADVLTQYDAHRDYPARNGTSRISHALRFGEISTASAYRKAFEYSEKWLNELIWREFYQMILFHFPHVVTENFKAKYNNVRWDVNESHFARWQQGETGYAIVDAGMRELNKTGFMHNRVRMITASFLCKQLCMDWRLGEAYFAEKLLDYELASNNGGWQWAAGTGCDAAPYFRIFNPYTQIEKFDPNLEYIKQWVPEYGSKHYASEIVDYKKSRAKALDMYKSALS